MIWLRASFELSAAAARQPQAFYLYAKASSRVYLNGRLIGSNGVPAATAGAELPGRMDSRYYLPPELLRSGDNELVLQLSSHHGWLQLGNPIHFVGIGEYGATGRLIQQFSGVGLVLLGIFLVGVIYFGVISIGSAQRFTYRLFALMSLLAGLQLWAELSRVYVGYRYPVQDLRLLAIASLSVAFGSCLLLYMARRFGPPASWQRWFVLGVTATLALLMAMPGYDAKTALGTLIPVLMSGLIALSHWYRQRQSGPLLSAGFLFAFGLLIVLTLGAFHELLYFILVGLLLACLFIQQAVVFRRQREQRIEDRETIAKLRLALAQAQESEQPSIISITLGDAIERISSNEIAYCKAEGDYSQVCLLDNRELLFSGNLKKLQAQLPSTFLRVHRSYLVNLEQVASLHRNNETAGSALTLANQAVVPVSRRLMPEVREAVL